MPQMPVCCIIYSPAGAFGASFCTTSCNGYRACDPPAGTPCKKNCDLAGMCVYGTCTYTQLSVEDHQYWYVCE
jgi:hypothetical protein